MSKGSESLNDLAAEASTTNLPEDSLLSLSPGKFTNLLRTSKALGSKLTSADLEHIEVSLYIFLKMYDIMLATGEKTFKAIESGLENLPTTVLVLSYISAGGMALVGQVLKLVEHKKTLELREELKGIVKDISEGKEPDVSQDIRVIQLLGKKKKGVHVSKEWKTSIVKSQKSTKRNFFGNVKHQNTLKTWKGLHLNIPNSAVVFDDYKYYGYGLENIPLRLKLLVAFAQKMGKETAQLANKMFLSAGSISGIAQFKERSIRSDRTSKRFDKLLKDGIVMEQNYPEIVHGLLLIVRTTITSSSVASQQEMTMKSLKGEMTALKLLPEKEKSIVAEAQIKDHFKLNTSFLRDLQNFLFSHVDHERLERMIYRRDTSVLVELCESAETEFETVFWEQMIKRFEPLSLVDKLPKAILSQFIELTLKIIWLPAK